MQRTYQLSQIVPTRADEEMAALLVREGLPCHFTAGAVIQQQGDDGAGFWLISAGGVSICRFGREGNVTVYAVLGAGDLFGELAHFTGISRQVDIIAETDVTLIRIDAKTIEHLLNREPKFARWLLKSMANQLRIAIDRIDSDRNLSAEKRVLRTLSDMVKRDGPELLTTHETLANFIGVSRITIGHILNKLAKTGIIKLGYRKISVTQIGALMEHADLVDS